MSFILKTKSNYIYYDVPEETFIDKYPAVKYISKPFKKYYAPISRKKEMRFYQLLQPGEKFQEENPIVPPSPHTKPKAPAIQIYVV